MTIYQSLPIILEITRIIIYLNKFSLLIIYTNRQNLKWRRTQFNLKKLSFQAYVIHIIMNVIKKNQNSQNHTLTTNFLLHLIDKVDLQEYLLQEVLMIPLMINVFNHLLITLAFLQCSLIKPYLKWSQLNSKKIRITKVKSFKHP